MNMEDRYEPHLIATEAHHRFSPAPHLAAGAFGVEPPGSGVMPETMMAREISNSEDVIDSCDVIARIKDLESELEDLEQDIRDAEEAVTDAEADAEDPDIEGAAGELEEAQAALRDAQAALIDWRGEYSDELEALKALQDDAEGYCADWHYGATLIRDSYFEDYAREFAEDIGAIKRDMEWPCNCIDWEQAASELRQDYTSVEFDGVTYWVR